MLQGDTPVSNTDAYATTPTTLDDWVSHVGAHVMVLIPDKELARHPLCRHHDPVGESRALKRCLPCVQGVVFRSLNCGAIRSLADALTVAPGPSQPSSDSADRHTP